MSVSNNELCNLAYEGKTALFTMRREASPDLIQLKDNSGRTALHWAAAARQVDIVLVISRNLLCRSFFLHLGLIMYHFIYQL